LLITLTTDFGTQDAYVGLMKGVMAGIAPGVVFVDLTHEVPPQGVRSAACLLWTAIPYFPQESVHLAVVDPGVGTARRPLAARTPWGFLVGPDNGVFSYVWTAAPPDMIVQLEAHAYQRPVVSSTFHGRDIFAPAAAYLAAGVPLEALGSLLTDPVRLPPPYLDLSGGDILGEVLHVDHFGNAITSIGRLVWEGHILHLDPAFGSLRSIVLLPEETVSVVAGGQDFGPIRRAYGEVAPGERLALVGSEGMLELAVSHGHAGTALGLRVGDVVEIRRGAER
jgi:S-adenosylmethionine hydrolase